MLLGDLLARFEDEAVAAETILRLGDLALVAALRECAKTNGPTLGNYAGCAARRFAAEASDVQWVTLTNKMTRAEDPGAVYPKQALAYAPQCRS